MTQQPRAERPTVLSVQIGRAISSYVSRPVGPTLADHVADEVIAWLLSWPEDTRSGGAGPKPFLIMPGDEKGSHVSAKREEHKAEKDARRAGGITTTSKRYFRFTWPSDSVVRIAATGMAVGKIQKEMVLLIDDYGRWEVDFTLGVYCPIYFWMDVTGYKETGGWPLFHFLIPPKSYAVTGVGVGYPLTFTGTDPTVPGCVEQVSHCTRYGQGQVV